MGKDEISLEKRPYAVWIITGRSAVNTPSVFSLDSIESLGTGTCDDMYTLNLDTKSGERYQWQYSNEDARNLVFEKLCEYFNIVKA